ncbi:MAG: helix-turn-helix domain-containing protein [Candidatus Thermoplasmatota archaeon]
MDQPGLRVWKLGEVLSMSDRAVYHHVKRLVAAGLVETKKAGAYHGLEATPLLMAVTSGSRGMCIRSDDPPSPP